MSKQSDEKAKQGYVPKAVPQVCANCASFKCDKVPNPWNPSYVAERNRRCGIGGFAVKKMGTCDLFSGRE